MLTASSPALTILLGALTALGPLAMDIYLVSVPSMAEAFGATVSQVQLTLSVYMVGFAAGQLVYGPITDGFGRRPALLGGLVIYVAASIVAAMALTIEVLIAARFFQALGMCSGVVVSRAIVRDLFERERAARLMSTMAMVMGVAPIVAPIIGSYLHVAFGWRSNFVFVTGYGIAALVVVYFHLGETSRHIDRGALTPRRILGTWRALITSRVFVGYALTAACTGGALFAFISGAPYVLLSVFGFPESTFGYLFGFVMLGNITGATLGRRLVMRYKIEGLLFRGVTLAVIAGGSMAVLAWAHVDHVAAVVVPMFLFMVAFALVLPQSMAGALTPFPHMAGNASALLGLFQFSFASLVGISVGDLFDGTQRPMAEVIGAMTVLAWLSFILIVRPAKAP
jgi:MFS transporter, DHA1 family, multidrug resistance protein